MIGMIVMSLLPQAILAIRQNRPAPAECQSQ
jgi:hypothetical protein